MTAGHAPLALLPPLRDVIARHNLIARKGLGQHFILDLNLTGRIARAAGDLTTGTVIEVGPGPGGLTRALLSAGAAKVVAIERDPRAVAALADLVEAAAGSLEVLHADARALDLGAIGVAPRRIVANLPYNVGTSLLIDWLRNMACFESLTLMFQKEVADRLTASPGGADYGRLSVFAQLCAVPRRLFDIPPSAFTPPPRVVSTVVSLTPPRRAPRDLASLEAVSAAAFGQRRKMLRQSLKSLGVDPIALAVAAGIDPTRRAETLTLDKFERLAAELTRLRAGD